tara:strand:- start:219 stop:965 length:747 start_codon:yes stop_codon:yes gene_type:complete
MEPKFNLPTETVDLPSKGLLYPKDSPLSSGKIEMKYMTAKEEDILSNVNYISNGTALDRVLKSLIVDKKINFNQLLIGDKNAIMIAARILSYGKEYKFTVRDEEHSIDLSKLGNKKIDEKLLENGNEFDFTLPKTGNKIKFKLLTQEDENKVQREVEGRKKIDKNSNTEGSTRLKFMITSVNENKESKDIRDFVDNYMLASDAREFRKYYITVSPDVDMIYKFENDNGEEEEVDIPIGINFFWPDFRI